MKCLQTPAAIVCLLTFTALPMYAAKPKVHPNAMKYQDAGARPATGRSGSAAIEVRALRGLSQTAIEVTTGHFDSSTTPPGRLEKVQVKFYDSHDKVVVVDNYRKSLTTGGYGSFEYDSAYRGQKFQVQANIKGIDGSRTDVVTIADTVKLGPDLAATRLQVAPLAKLHARTPIIATVRERNGDVGARANCVLRVDGSVVDRAEGIWVDAADAVTCEFTHQFTSLGVKQVAVDVTNVAPADYDTANNTVTAQVEVVDTSFPVLYTFVAHDITEESESGNRHLDEFVPSDGSQATSFSSANSTTMTRRSADYSVAMFFNRAMTFPVSLDSTLLSDGEQVLAERATMEVTSVTGDPSTRLDTCSSSLEYPHWLEVCSTSVALGGGQVLEFTMVRNWLQSESTVYYSQSTSVFRFGTDEFVFSSNSTEVIPYGPQPSPHFGNHLDFRAAVTDVHDVYDVDLSVDTSPVESTIPFSEDCQTWDDTTPQGRFRGYDCFSFVDHSFGRQAVAFGTEAH